MTTAVRSSRFGDFRIAEPKANGHDALSSSRQPRLAYPLSKGGLDWSSSIWGNSAIGTGLASAKQEYTKPRDLPLSSALFPATSDSDPWLRKRSHWTLSDSSAATTGARRASGLATSQFIDTLLPPIPRQSAELQKTVNYPTSLVAYKEGEIVSRDTRASEPTIGQLPISHDNTSTVPTTQGFGRIFEWSGDQRDATASDYNSWAVPSFSQSPTTALRNDPIPDHVGPLSAGALTHQRNIPPPRGGIAGVGHAKPPQDWLRYQQNQPPLQDFWSTDGHGSSAFAPHDRNLTNIRSHRDSSDLPASFERMSITDEQEYPPPRPAPIPGLIGTYPRFSQPPSQPEPSRPTNPHANFVPSNTSWGSGLYNANAFVPRPFADQFDSFRNIQPVDQSTQERNDIDVRRGTSDHQPFMRGKSHAGIELVVAAGRNVQSSRDYTTNRPTERWYAYAQQEQEQLMRHHMQQMMAVHMRGQYLNQFAYGLPDIAMNGCLSYLPVPPIMMPSRMPTAELGSEPDADRSALLDEFRNSLKTNRRFELREIYDHIVEFSGDQHGSRFIQQKLETANSDEKERVFRELCRDAIALMKDVFGNYVIQKLFEHGDQNQKKVLANKMKGQVLELTTQIYGCRVVQKALEHVLVDQQVSIMKELEHHILKCVKDQHGNHVIQVAIGRVPAEFIRVIANALVGQVQQLASHPFGCRVVQRILERTDVPETAIILQELHASAIELIADQYGNYVTGHVIEHGSAEDRGRFISLVIANFIFFAKQKFASHVVEKSIEFGTDEQRRRMMSQLSTKDGFGESPLPSLIKDSFGNYVIQKLLDYLNDAAYVAFVELLKPEIVNVRRLTTNNKQADNVAKKMHRLDPPFLYHHHMNPGPHPLNLDTSATSTPALTTDDAHSPFSSSLPSTVGDALPPHMENINHSTFPDSEIKIEISEPCKTLSTTFGH